MPVNDLIEKRNSIETYRGPRPICNQCGAPLKPQYNTVKDYQGTQKKTRRRPATEDEIGYGRDDIQEDSRGKFVREIVTSIISRTFLGHFGFEDRFCNKTTCAVEYAVANTVRRFRKEDL